MMNKTYIIYLAAGNSQRFKENKLLYPINGQPLYLYGLNTIRELLKIRQDIEVIIVSNYFIINEPHIITLKSPKSYLGISYSIKTALNYLKVKTGSFQMLFMVSDQPFIKPPTLNKMIDAFNQSSCSICTLAYQDEVGNPVIFSNKYYHELYTLKGDQGGRKIANQYFDDCLQYYTDEELELYDIDHKSDLKDIVL